jgi:hypothetical protein
MLWLQSRHDHHQSFDGQDAFMMSALAWAMPAKAPPDIPAALLDYAESALGEQIDTARQQAIADGVRPMPTSIFRALLGYFPSALLQRCRFATGNSRALTLPALPFSFGDASALTLGDVILLKSDRVAETDLKVWAHELTHVMQYERWGVEGFAGHYVRDAAAVEQEAIDNTNRFVAWRAEQAAR